MDDIHTFVVLAYKESLFLEDCIKSVLNQTVKTNVKIATSTPNDFINELAKKYSLEVVVNEGKKGIGYDFDFAANAANTKLVTIAHQDDIYDKDYAKSIIEAYNNQKDSIIIFPDYYEIRNGKNVYKNLNLNIKNILLKPLRNHNKANKLSRKRAVLKYGNAISCPSVTFVKANVPKEIFACDLKCNIDWYAWERLSKLDGYFYYIHKPLMGHRISEESTTTKMLKDNIRTKEDKFIFSKFWPKWFARIITKVYSLSEKSNKVK